MPRRRALIASSLVVALLLVGCGSDDDSSDDDDATTTTVEDETTTESTEAEDEPEETTAPEEPTETTEAPAEDETTTTAAPVGEGEGDPEFCAAYGAFDEQFSDLPDETVDDIKAGAAALRDGLAELVPLAPEGLTADMEILAQAGVDLVEVTADATTVEEAQQASGEVFLDEEFSAAAERVDEYYRTGCPEANDDQADG
jgi:hypothetical protein